MGRVVAGDGVQSPVPETFHQGVAVLAGAQGRVHLVIGAARAAREVVLGQGEVVGSGLGGDREAGALGAAHQVHGPGAAHMADVEAAARERGQGQVAQGHERLGGGGDAGQAQALGEASFMDDASGRQMVVLRVVEHGKPGGPREEQGPAHELRVHDRAAVVADGRGPGLMQGFQVGEPFSPLAQGEGAGEEDMDGRVAPGDAPRGMEPGRGIGRRERIGHGEHRANAARGPRSAQDGLILLPPGLAQMDMHVYDAGDHPTASGINDAYIARNAGAFLAS